jgi:hypothetical protein
MKKGERRSAKRKAPVARKLPLTAPDLKKENADLKPRSRDSSRLPRLTCCGTRARCISARSRREHQPPSGGGRVLFTVQLSAI